MKRLDRAVYVRAVQTIACYCFSAVGTFLCLWALFFLFRGHQKSAALVLSGSGVVMGILINIGRPILVAGFVRLHSRFNKGFLGLNLLKLFRWFCTKESRSQVELSIADLKRDISEMRQDRRGRAFIGCVVLWRAMTTILPIVWDGIWRTLKAVLPLYKMLK